jgi:hypothetical protein
MDAQSDNTTCFVPSRMGGMCGSASHMPVVASVSRGLIMNSGIMPDYEKSKAVYVNTLSFPVFAKIIRIVYMCMSSKDN